MAATCGGCGCDGGAGLGAGGAGFSGPFARSAGVGAPSTFSGVLPRANGIAFSGFGAFSRVALERSLSDSSAGRLGGAIRSFNGIICTNRTWSSC